jgi:hypothetical protein
LEKDEIKVPMTKRYRWLEGPGRTIYYRPTKATPKVQQRFETLQHASRAISDWIRFLTAAGLIRQSP